MRKMRKSLFFLVVVVLLLPVPAMAGAGAVAIVGGPPCPEGSDAEAMTCRYTFASASIADATGRVTCFTPPEYQDFVRAAEHRVPGRHTFYRSSLSCEESPPALTTGEKPAAT